MPQDDQKPSSVGRRRPIRILDAVRLTRQQWLNLFDLAYIDATGRQKTWQIASRAKTPKVVSGGFEAPDAVVIVARHVQLDKLVVTREFRIALGGYEYGFPAGLIDEGETAEAAAERELMEETGLRVSRILRVGPPVFSSTGMTDESVSMVYLECDGHANNAGNQASEDIEVIYVSASEARSLVDDPGIKFDAKAWLALNHYAAVGAIA